MKYNSNRFLFLDNESPKLIGLIEDDEISALHLLGKNNGVGNIFRGYVKNVVESMDCAFVDFGEKETGYVPMKNVYPKDYRKTIKGGDTVICEIKKMPIKDKRAVLTLDYSLRGEYLVLLPNSEGIRVSKKIEDLNIRQRLTNWAKSLNTIKGIIIRTEAMHCDEDDLELEYLQLYERYEKIEKSRNFLPKTKLLLAQNRVADIFRRHDTLPVIINDKSLGEYVPENREIVLDPSFSIRSTAKWRSQFNGIFAKTLSLPSGGNIVINETEACHVIDVNSASVRKDGTFSAMRIQLNEEAARKIARQINLRNLSGMIVIDFLHGMNAAEKKAIKDILEAELKGGPLMTKVYGFSTMGLFEIARERKELSFQRDYERAKEAYVRDLKDKIKSEK